MGDDQAGAESVAWAFWACVGEQALSLRNKEIPWSDALRIQLELPAEVKSRDGVIVYSFNQAIDFDREYECFAHLFFGWYLWPTDCVQALEHLRSHVELTSEDKYNTRRILEKSAELGCENIEASEVQADWFQ